MIDKPEMVEFRFSASSPHRVQLRRVKGWKTPPNTVRVCRPSKWGNPFPISDVLEHHNGDKRAARLDVINAYRCWLLDHLLSREPIAELHGKNLACWCSLDQPCHADVLLELANSKPSNADPA